MNASDVRQILAKMATPQPDIPWSVMPVGTNVEPAVNSILTNLYGPAASLWANPHVREQPCDFPIEHSYGKYIFGKYSFLNKQKHRIYHARVLNIETNQIRKLDASYGRAFSRNGEYFGIHADQEHMTHVIRTFDFKTVYSIQTSPYAIHQISNDGQFIYTSSDIPDEHVVKLPKSIYRFSALDENILVVNDHHLELYENNKEPRLVWHHHKEGFYNDIYLTTNNAFAIDNTTECQIFDLNGLLLKTIKGKFLGRFVLSPCWILRYDYYVINIWSEEAQPLIMGRGIINYSRQSIFTKSDTVPVLKEWYVKG